MKCTLLVRGISCIVPGVEGYTDNVEVVSIVGRLLEHSRIYGFGPRENRELYLSSADLMTRNMEKRVEIAWPIYAPALKERVNSYLDVSLADTAKLRMLKNDLEYTPLEFFASTEADGQEDSFDSQAYLIKKARDDYHRSVELREEEAARKAEIARIERIKAAQKEEEAAAKAAEQAEAEAAAAAESEAEEQAAAEPIQPESTEVPISSDKVLTAKPVIAPEQPQKKPAHAAPESSVSGLEEVEPGVAGPAIGSSAPAPEPKAEVLPAAEQAPAEPQQDNQAIQLVPKKASLWQRIKFLFTGRL